MTTTVSKSHDENVRDQIRMMMEGEYARGTDHVAQAVQERAAELVDIERQARALANARLASEGRPHEAPAPNLTACCCQQQRCHGKPQCHNRPEQPGCHRRERSRSRSRSPCDDRRQRLHRRGLPYYFDLPPPPAELVWEQPWFVNTSTTYGERPVMVCGPDTCTAALQPVVATTSQAVAFGTPRFPQIHDSTYLARRKRGLIV